MDFERGRDVKEAIDIGIFAKAPIVHSILLVHKVPAWVSDSPRDEALIREDSDNYHRILKEVSEGKRKTRKVYVEFIDKEGKIYSGKSPLECYQGRYVRYQDKLYSIPMQ